MHCHLDVCLHVCACSGVVSFALFLLQPVVAGGDLFLTFEVGDRREFPTYICKVVTHPVLSGKTPVRAIMRVGTLPLLKSCMKAVGRGFLMRMIEVLYRRPEVCVS